MNPRDTAVNMNRRRMIRRGGTYGPPLPEGAPDDGVERGIAAFIGCASLVRQFEFAQNVWVNDPNFHELENERDPIIGDQDGTFEYRSRSGRCGRRSRASRRSPPCGAAPTSSFPASGRCAFSPRRIVAGATDTEGDAHGRSKDLRPSADAEGAGRTYNQIHGRGSTRPAAGGSASTCAGAFPGRPTATVRAGQPLLDHDGSPPRRVAQLGGAGVGGPDDVPAGHRRRPRAVLPRLAAVPAARRRSHRARRAGVPARRPGRLPAAAR